MIPTYTSPRKVATLALGLGATLMSLVLVALENNGTLPHNHLYIVPGALVFAYWFLSFIITDSVREGMVLAQMDLDRMAAADGFGPDEDDDAGAAPGTLNSETFAAAAGGAN